MKKKRNSSTYLVKWMWFVAKTYRPIAVVFVVAPQKVSYSQTHAKVEGLRHRKYPNLQRGKAETLETTVQVGSKIKKICFFCLFFSCTNEAKGSLPISPVLHLIGRTIEGLSQLFLFTCWLSPHFCVFLLASNLTIPL